MEFQEVFNWIITAGLTAAGWFLRQIWDAAAELRRDLHDIETELPTHYVRKEELHDLLRDMKNDYKADIREIKELCTTIIVKLDQKADRNGFIQQ